MARRATSSQKLGLSFQGILARRQKASPGDNRL
ncbi:hypothetical protein A2U01_0060911, partial [Trifolium medium]|nr:hypothetical protein [Trifolium medium]